MKIYIAARYPRMREMMIRAKELRDMGHSVTSTWVDGAEIGQNEQFAAMMDVRDLKRAECCLSFTEPHGSANAGGGRHVEFGMAITLGLFNVIVGEREQVFHHLPKVLQFDTWGEALSFFREKCPSSRRLT